MRKVRVSDDVMESVAEFAQKHGRSIQGELAWLAQVGMGAVIMGGQTGNQWFANELEDRCVGTYRRQVQAAIVKFPSEPSSLTLHTP